ncbi:MAG: hypothetical protein ACUVX9_09225 [Anaerolineae bacterium]
MSPVPAVPSVVLALGGALQHKLSWLERRFRTEIGQVYPGTLLRFRLINRAEQLALEALHALCDPLLLHPLWLGLREKGLMERVESGPELCFYAIAAEEDLRGCRLLPNLYAALARLYPGQLSPRLCLFYIGTDPSLLPRPTEADRLRAVCFLLGPIKRYGYRAAGRQEPFETVRLALNAFLASGALAEELPMAPGVRFCALGASAIAVARPQMETWLRNTLLQRLAQACLTEQTELAAAEGSRLAARAEVADLFGLQLTDDWRDEPQELWEKGLGRRFRSELCRWAGEALAAWGIEVHETRRGHWRLTATREGDLYRHLQQLLSPMNELQEDAQVALSQDIVHLAEGVRRHLAEREQVLLRRWSELPQRFVARGAGALAGLNACLALIQAGLDRARDGLHMQRASPLWLRSDGDIVALADILTAQMAPVRCAAERAHLAFASPERVALRLVPLTLLLGAAGADLVPGGLGAVAGLTAGVLLIGAAAVLQYRLLWRERLGGVRELVRLYEESISGLLIAEARNVVQHLQQAADVAAAQLRAVEGELHTLDAEAGRALEELARFPRENTYLERQLSDPGHCAQIAAQVSLKELLSPAALDDGAGGPTPTQVLAATLRGDLPAAALSAGLVEAVGRIVARKGCGFETRVEELLVAGADGPFSAEDAMEALQQRALPLWPGDERSHEERHVVVMSREAAMAFRGWLAAREGTVRVLPTLQRDRISYLRIRPLSPDQSVETSYLSPVA